MSMQMDNRGIYCVCVRNNREALCWKLCKLQKNKQTPTNLTSVLIERLHLGITIYLVCTADSLQFYMYSKETVRC